MGALLYSTIPTISCLLWGINRKLNDKKKEDARNGTVTLDKKKDPMDTGNDDDER